MEREILKTLMKIEAAVLMKKGVHPKDAIRQAAKKLAYDMRQAEFETYCNEHNC